MPAKSKYLRGQLLLDGGELRGSWFHRSVVLICEHDAKGAFGLVLNRTSGARVGDAILAELPENVKDLPLYVGGPVQPSAMSFLHWSAASEDPRFMTHLELGHSLDDLARVAAVVSPANPLRLFAGYAGWQAGQLEEEMKRKAWLTHPASVDLVFHSDPDHLWRGVLRQKGWPHALLADAPDDLSAN